MRNKLVDALDFAEEKHKFQKRKGSDIPYFDHILKVVQVLQEYGASINVMVAGALHDTIEDTDTTIEDIVSLFGVEVAYMVDTVTEKKGLPYEDRKKLQSLRIGGATKEIKMLKCADCIANLTDTEQQMKQEGFWNLFNAPKAEIKKHYQDTLFACRELEGEKIYAHFEGLFNKIFAEEKVLDANSEALKKFLTPEQIDWIGECDKTVGAEATKEQESARASYKSSTLFAREK